jgi:hypothetical protein
MRTMRAVVADQLREFVELYGTEPTHLDGHEHAHLNPTSLVCLPSRLALRPAHDPGGDRQGRTPRPPASALSAVHPALGGAGLDHALELAASYPVEIMVHLDRDGSCVVVRESAWTTAIRRCRLGSYTDLRSR